MKPEIPLILSILQEACAAFGYSWQLIDTHSNNLVKVSDGGKSFFASNSKTGTYPLNSAFAAGIANDKAWCYHILKQKGYKIPQGDYFFVTDDYREMRGVGKELIDGLLFADGKYPVFAKPNDKSSGLLAEIIYDKPQLEQHLQEISKISFIALIQEVIRLPEYRIFAVDGETKFIYQRSAPSIVGDGKKTIEEMIDLINKNAKGKGIKITENIFFLKQVLEKNSLTFQSILEQDESLNVSAKANIGSGGTIKNYSERVSKETQQWTRRLMEDLSLRVCGIDVFVQNTVDNPEGFTIIEVNHSPSLAGIYELGKKEKALRIWGEILKKYFEDR